uniref:Ring finger protein 150 n=1 Tax=Cyanistes caeruleus TaxID=156563 RepID=A0A8C0ZKE3_CYACU
SASPADRFACDPGTRFNAPAPGKSWVALIPRGNCTYKDKIRHAAAQNASAVVIYNVGSSNANETITMPHAGLEDVVAIMIPEPKGKEIVSLLERNITVMMYITIGTRNLQKYVSRTSVVFVSISFIVLMIISLAWLVFYYIQRFRYANARDRNQRRLGDAAKKAISKLQVRTIRKGDKETEPDFDNCAVCIEGYKPNDVVRILPCRHLFHKSCVDPWLLDHRTCPMCKMNILKALGIPPNADCMDDLPPDLEASIGGPPTNQITGASDITVNESSVALDPPARTMGVLQVIQDADFFPQAVEGNFTTNEQEPAVSSDSDISLIMAMEVGLSDVELSTDQDCEEVKS